MPIPFSITDRMMHAARLKNHSALAADLGITPQALSNYKRRGEMPPGLVMDFAEKHGLSVDWLVFGKKSEEVWGVSPLSGIVINLAVTREEQVYLEKALTVLRSPNAMLAEVFRHSLDALVEAQDRGALHV